MSSQSGAAGEIFIFESEKCRRIQPLKMDTLTVSVFNAFIHIHDKSKKSVFASFFGRPEDREFVKKMCLVAS